MKIIKIQLFLRKNIKIEKQFIKMKIKIYKKTKRNFSKKIIKKRS